MVSLLSKLGISKCKVVNDGMQAVEEVKKGDHYDIILMDLHMPHLSGIEATIIIRELEKQRVRKLKIIATTASVTPEEMKKCLSTGMDEFLPKPVRLSSLKNVLTKYTSEGGYIVH